MKNRQGHVLRGERIAAFRDWLTEEEKSRNTTEKYIRDVRAFAAFLAESGGMLVSKLRVMAYKEMLQARYAVSSVNSMLVAVNRFLRYLGWDECCVRLLKCQRRVFREERRELSKAEYLRLVAAARRRRNERLSLLMETICSTGIRVSELRHITVEAIRRGRADISCKGKQRSIFLPKRLCRTLLQYVRKQRITAGCVFRSKNGRPLDRSNIWHEMKALCRAAGIEPSKVFPHNLRHLFARTVYTMEKDIVRLADLLGHSSIDTTRIYTISSGAEHARKLERLGLVI